jgi:hypothetical protein
MNIDPISILKRAWKILWSYRTLWIFGIILALTTASYNGNTSGAQTGGGDNGFELNPPAEIQRELGEIGRELGEIFEQGEVPGGLIALGVGLACLSVILIVIGAIARYVSETALIRMVDDYEIEETQRSVRDGFGMGWSRAAWRIFLIGLVITVPLAVVFILLLAFSAAPLLAWLFKSVAVGVMGTIAAIGLFFLTILLIILVSTIAELLKRFARRACAIEDLGVLDAIRRGAKVISTNLKEIGLMWLIMFGVNLGYSILMILVFLLLLALGGITGGLVLLLVRGIAGLFTTGAFLPWLIGGLIGAPVFFLVMGAPLLFLRGLHEVYKSTVWTLTFREVTVPVGAELEPEAHPTTPQPPAEPARPSSQEDVPDKPEPGNLESDTASV